MRGEEIKIEPYFGRSTEIKIEKQLSKNIVYVAGIPALVERNQIAKLVSAVAPLRDFYIPRNAEKLNRHFAFAICKSPKGKE